MLELAHHSDSLIVPLVIATAGATVVARMIGAPSIYSARLGQNGSADADESLDAEPLGRAEVGVPVDHKPRA
jgi:H+/Cl- antiporter ClcA